MAFKLSCPRCKATPDKAILEVVRGTFEARHMYLGKDGFSITDAKPFDTSDEIVYCHACNELISLGECLDEEGA